MAGKCASVACDAGVFSVVDAAMQPICAQDEQGLTTLPAINCPQGQAVVSINENGLATVAPRGLGINFAPRISSLLVLMPRALSSVTSCQSPKSMNRFIDRRFWSVAKSIGRSQRSKLRCSRGDSKRRRSNRDAIRPTKPRPSLSRVMVSGVMMQVSFGHTCVPVVL